MNFKIAQREELFKLIVMQNNRVVFMGKYQRLLKTAKKNLNSSRNVGPHIKTWKTLGYSHV